MDADWFKNKRFDLYESDFPQERLAHYLGKKAVAVDTETRGLLVMRDRLCLVQVCDEENVVSLIRYGGGVAPNLKRLLEAPGVLKVFHFARFDVAVLKHYLGVQTAPIWCTKIASKLVRTYSDKHGLKELAREYLGMEIDKTDQMSDWANRDLTGSQLAYAASDVAVLLPLHRMLAALLKRENREDLALRLFACVPAVVDADILGWKDIFEH